MSELCANLQPHIDNFDRYITTQFVGIDISDLGHMIKEVVTFQDELSFHKESHMTVTPPVIPQWLRYHLRLGLGTLIYFTKNKKEFLVGGTKRGDMGDLQNPNISQDQAWKNARYMSLESIIYERGMHAEIESSASFSYTPLPSSPSLVDIPQSWDAHDTEAQCVLGMSSFPLAYIILAYWRQWAIFYLGVRYTMLLLFFIILLFFHLRWYSCRIDISRLKFVTYCLLFHNMFCFV